MIAGLADSVLATFVVFCRIGACMMLVPGFSSINIPPQIRLFAALVTTVALAPALAATLGPMVGNAGSFALASLICSELLIGSIIGMGGRMLFLALQAMAVLMTNLIGLSAIPGLQVGDTDPAPALVPLITATVTTLFFVTDQHWLVLQGLMNSYGVWHPGDRLGSEMPLAQLVNQLSEAFVLTLRITSPFIVYSVIINLALGLVNKLTPTIPVYFVSVPFVLFGGILLFYLTGDELLAQSSAGLSTYLGR